MGLVISLVRRPVNIVHSSPAGLPGASPCTPSPDVRLEPVPIHGNVAIHQWRAAAGGLAGARFLAVAGLSK